MRNTAIKTLTGVAAALLIAAFAPFTIDVAGPSTLGVSLGTDDAKADYTVSQCDSSKNTGLDNWRVGSDGWAAQNLCSGGFNVTGLVNGSYVGNGSVAYWRTPNLPGNLSFQSVTYEGSGSLQSAFLGVARFCMNDVDPWCNSGGSAWVINNAGWVGRSDAASGAREFQLLLSCFGASPCPRTTFSNIWLRNLSFVMRDSETPATDWWTSSSLKVNGQWNRGTQTANPFLTDQVSGIERGVLTFDSNPSHPLSDTKLNTCNRVAGGAYSTFIPCTLWFFPNHSVNTAALSDGAHTLQETAYDASGNAVTNVQSFKVDNTDPAQPDSVDVVGDNSNGWRTSNDFDLTWTNSGESAETLTQSGIAQSCVDVPPPPGGGVNPAPVCVNGAVASVDNITVPSDGVWDADLYTIDRAGNESDHEPITLKLDTTTPPPPNNFANGWVNRVELLAGYEQQWNIAQNNQGVTSGICGYVFKVDTNPTLTLAEMGSTMNVAGNVGGAEVPANLSEGDYYTHVRGISCAGAASSTITNTGLPLDLTDPTLDVAGVPSNGWTKSLALSASATDARSGMAGVAAPNPIDGGAYIEYIVDGSTAAQHRGASGDLTNDTEGLHTVTVNAYDVAGNKAVQALSLGVDKTSPSGLFDLQDPNRPTLIQMPVDDPLSGVASARVEVRKVGDSGDWTPLHTSIQKRGDTTGTAAAGSLNAATVVARFTDTKLPKGTYAVRSVVTDSVGNEYVGTKSVNGQDLVLSNPMRRGSLISAGFGGRKVVCGNGKNLRKVKGCKRIKITCVKGKNKGKKKCWKVQRKVIIEGHNTKVTIPYRRSGVVKGIFNRADGTPGANAQIDVYATPRGGSEQLIGRTTTDRDGYYALKVKAGVSRTVRAEYAGTELEEDASATAQLDVAAAATLRLSKKSVGLRKPVYFTGKVYSDTDAVIPPGGLRVALQAKAGKKWIPAIKTATRTDANGKFKFKYSFKKLRTRSRIAFRVVVLPDSTWPFATGYSASRVLLVVP